MLSETRQIKRLKYKIFCPLGNSEGQSKAKAKGKKAVLCFLHGSAEHSGYLSIDKALKCHGPLKNDKATREALGDHFYVIFPQLPAPGGDVWRKYTAEINEIVTSVWEEYGGDPKRTYLSGFSYGGNGVYHLASLLPGLWAAIWPVDPVLKPIPGSKIPVWLSLGQYSRSQKSNLQKQGYQDVNKAGSRAKTIYIDYKEDHVGTATSAYRDHRVYDWLLKKKVGAKRSN